MNTTVESSPKTSTTAQLRSHALTAAAEGRFDEARRLLELALAHDGGAKVELMGDMAAVALRCGELVQAIQLARLVLNVAPHDDPATFTLAMALSAIGSHCEAIELFDGLGRSPTFNASTPALVALVTTELARLRSLRGVAAVLPVASITPVPVCIAKPPTAPDLSAREFIWGRCNPFDDLPKLLSPRGTEGWYSDHPLFEELVRTRRPRRLVEVGSLLGASAIHIAKQLKQHGVNGEITCVDTFLGSREHFFDMRWEREAMLSAGRYHFFDEFLGNVAHSGHAEMITPFPQSSTVAARIMREAGRTFDFVYLDASHEYRDVLNDLREWWPLVAPGGVLLGDDFEHPWFGVIRAATEFADEIGQPLTTHRAFASSPIGGRENTKFMLSRG